MNTATHSVPRLETGFACAALALLPALLPTHAFAQQPSHEWNFEVLLDDRPIGSHRFVLADEAGGRVLESTARFDVKLLMFTAYHYRHEAREEWQDGCLRRLKSSTDDDGKPFRVNAAVDAAGSMLVKTGASTAAATALSGCVMSYAYWNPAILKQRRLLNAQTGSYDAVTIEPLGTDAVSVHGSAGAIARGAIVEAAHFRIKGPAAPIDLWYGPDSQWLALESVLDGGRRLRYRLQ